MRREERYIRAIEMWRKAMPEVGTELVYGSVFQLLVATLLSAQCTDKRVNSVTPRLFSRYPTPKEMAESSEEEIRDMISSVSYPNAKARHLVVMARALMDKHGGTVPHDMDELTALPGVGRKTANVVRSVAFGIPAMAVDTHVYRVSHRMGLVDVADNTPEKVERRLMKHINRQDVAKAHHWILLHGRYVCRSRKPLCEECAVACCCAMHERNEKSKAKRKDDKV